jgi:hypothetical protein
MRSAPTITLEALLTSPHAFGLTTATPVQRAICRIADGLPLGELANDADVRLAVGNVDDLPHERPRELVLLAGIRGGKSLYAAALAVRASQTCDLSGLGAGETARVAIVSLTTDVARPTFDHLCGNVMAKPALRGLLIGEPTTDTVTLRHPSGRPVEIKVTAGQRAGGSLVARWMAGVIFDEAPRMLGEDDGVVNFDASRKAVLGRLLKGAQLVALGSPWAPRGPIYELVQERFGKPTSAMVVIRATGPMMNPVHWTPERIAQLRQSDEQTYRTDVLGEFADPESSLFSSAEIENATRATPLELPFQQGHKYAATWDAATRGNSWTLAISTTIRLPDGGTRKVVVLVKQWTGSKASPLSPETVIAEVAAICQRYGIKYVTGDQWSADALRAIAKRHGLDLAEQVITAPKKVELYESLRILIADGSVDLPPDPQLRADLLSIRKRVTQNGIAIELPRTADGRHADYAPAVALAVAAYTAPPPAQAPELSTEEWERQAAEHRRQEHRRQQLRQHGNSRRRLEEHEVRRAILRARGY